MQDFRNLEAWKKAHVLTLRVYAETQKLLREEVFGVTMQLRRSSIAIATRLSEACGRDAAADMAIDLRKACASCNELEYLILLAADLEFWGPELRDQLTQAAVEVRKMSYGLLRKL